MKVYLDIILTDDCFDIARLAKKPEGKDSALITLQKIEEVALNGLKYRSDFPDQYTDLTKEQVLERLWSAAEEIRENYQKKTEACFFKKIRGINKKQRQIEEAVERIRNLTCPSPISALPNELIQTIGLIGGIEVTSKIGQLCFVGHDNAAAALIQKAREFGYKGSNSDEAKKFIRNFFNQIKNLVSAGVIPKEYVIYKSDNNINFEETIKNLISINSENVFIIFAKKEIYEQNNKEFRDYLVKIFSNSPATKSSNEGKNAIHFALYEKQKDVVELLLKHGANPDSVPFDINVSFLSCVAQKGFASCVSLICDKKKYSPSDLNKALILAIRQYVGATKSKEDIAETVRILLEHGADPNVAASNGSPPLHFAAQMGHAEVVKLLLKYRADINAPGMRGETALGFAVKPWDSRLKEGHYETVKMLLEHGADPNIAASNGSPPLHFAAQTGHAEVVKLLLKYGADINAPGMGGETALGFAIKPWNSRLKEGHYETVKTLLEHGADPKKLTTEGVPLLHIAAQNGDADIITLLLEYGANIGDLSKEGNTALYIAINLAPKTECYAIVKLLLEKGSDPNFTASNGSPLLHFAAQNGLSDVVALLIEKGARINDPGSGGHTALSFAIQPKENRSRGECFATVRALLENGASPNIPGKNGKTPLHFAAQQGDSDFIPLLLEKEADIQCFDNNGDTALTLAAANNHEEAVELLLAFGASLDFLKDRDPSTITNNKRITNLLSNNHL